MATFQFLLPFLVLSFTEGVRRYHDCVVYETPEEYPDLLKEDEGNSDQVCVSDRAEGAYYCRLFTCQPLLCAANQQIRSPTSRCPYCEGTCSSGGKLHKVGTTFTCADQVNVCSCVSTGFMTTTVMNTNKYSLCESAKPADDRDPPTEETPRQADDRALSPWEAPGQADDRVPPPGEARGQADDRAPPREEVVGQAPKSRQAEDSEALRRELIRKILNKKDNFIADDFDAIYK
ncbi:uncharacterized protein LOC111111142 [Crassostrea virginica]